VNAWARVRGTESCGEVAALLAWLTRPLSSESFTISKLGRYSESRLKVYEFLFLRLKAMMQSPCGS